MGTVESDVAATTLDNTNNWPYTASTGLDPTVGVSDGITNLLTRINMVNFETVAQNLASLNYRETYTEEGLIIKTYYVTPTDTIVLTIDRSGENKIVKTLSGYGINGILTKTKAWVKGVVMDVVYS